MTKSITIHVVCDKGKDTITVRDDAGNEKNLKSVVVVGGDFDGQAFYAFSAGSSSDAGWALAKFWRFCRLSKREEEAHGVRLFNHFIAWVATFFGWRQETSRELTPEELMEKWAAEDDIKKVILDGRKLN